MSEEESIVISFKGAARLFEALERLGADQVDHSGGTLLEHLVGVASILQRWRGSVRVCKAGLFHSIYGTADFRQATLPFARRQEVQTLAGRGAERLAFLFCASNRSSIFQALEANAPRELKGLDGAKIPITASDLTDLVWMEWANLLDQAPRMTLSRADRARIRRLLAKSDAYLPEHAVRDLQAVFGRVTSRPRQQVKKRRAQRPLGGTRGRTRQ
jgi:hypothetical protein